MMNNNDLIAIKSNNNFVRYMTSRNLFYIFRRFEDGEYVTYYKRSKLYDEISEIYRRMSKEERNSFVEKHSQKAE